MTQRESIGAFCGLVGTRPAASLAKRTSGHAQRHDTTHLAYPGAQRFVFA